ncbi:DUF1439 domain-containing protein [Shewanella surugensis]|uniref:DUF1439 domain-containing protein n=1 Tax=Shewanella surugensis TaxID=212020 RepID=A0ABT0LFT2_9GAMM|nr:DUF1439 domain-containing protein [Shewanella surugensis]MCL1126192.1 DUF1439 domain-containing protein [Shewanella surugensis]
MKSKSYTLLLILPLILFLNGCISQYSVSESELESYLSKELTYDTKQGNQLLGMEMHITDIKVKLGEKPDTMGVSATTHVTINNPLKPIDAQLYAKFEAKPWYDVENHSVYLHQLKLVDVSSDNKRIEKLIKPLTPQLMNYLTQFLSTQPVYVLDTDDTKQAIIANMTKRIEVKPGEISLIFSD